MASTTTNAGADSDANLIVNYLPNSCTEAMLQELFSKYGTIENVKIVREKGTMKSMGYGFVKFATAAEAQRAIAALSGYQMENKKLKVAIARPQGSGVKNTNLYVAGLEPHMTSEELQSIFQTYGKVTELKVLSDPATKQSRCVGFVRFDTQEEADAAIAGLNGVTLPNASKPLIVRVAEEHRDRRTGMTQPAMMTARQGNMRYNPMGMYGPNMPQVGYQYPPGPYGQQYPSAAGFPPAYPPPGNMFGQQPYPGAANPVPPGVPAVPGAAQRDLSNTYCLFVYNLPPETDESYMYQLFGPYGAVANVKVMRDLTTNLCKGFGFVNMTKLDDAQTAISALNGAQIGTKTLQVSFKQNKNSSNSN